jgi:hypothetical protein
LQGNGSVKLSLLSVPGNGSANTPPRQQIQTTIEELLDASFSGGPCLIKGESVGLFVYPPIVAGEQVGKDVPAAKNF